MNDQIGTLSCNQIHGGVVHLGLELTEFDFELFNSLLEICLGLGFVSSQLVQCAHDLVSEFGQGINDVLD